MITAISSIISKYLRKKNIIKDEDYPVYQYGFEIVLSTILGFMVTFSIGCILSMKTLSLVYYVIFVFMRECTGGYHADSYLKCNIVFGVLSFLTMGMTTLISNSKQYDYYIFLLLIVVTLSVIWKYSPVENEYKPLSEEQIAKNHWLGFILAAILSIAGYIMLLYKNKLGVLIILTLFMISMLILVSKVMCKEKTKKEYE